MTRLIAALVRHGDYDQLPDTPSAHQPFALNATGSRQASAAAPAIADRVAVNGWTLCPVIDCSRLLRAWQTAQRIAEGLAARPGVVAELAEFDALAERGLGIVGNLTLQQIGAVMADDPRYPLPPADWKSDSAYRLPFPGAESLIEAGERVAVHIRRRMQALATAARDDTVKLFVGHGAAFRHAACHLGVLKRSEIAGLSMHHAQAVYLEYRRDTGWLHVDGAWKVRDRAQPPD